MAGELEGAPLGEGAIGVVSGFIELDGCVSGEDLEVVLPEDGSVFGGKEVGVGFSFM
jgi:hypothetical protein